MNDTPRTNDALSHAGSSYNDVIIRLERVIEVARKMERELQAHGELTLRDKLAAACLPAIYDRMTMLTDRAALLAYEQADEMLRSRRQHG